MSAQLLNAAQRQAEEIRETGDAVLQIAASINEVSARASESATVAGQSLAAASQGATAVQNAMAGMNTIREQIQETSKRIKRLGESSQEIGEIVELISDITEQTNVLAMNAAIQAGGEAYFRYRQIEMLPTIGPAIAAALAQSKMITLTGGASTGDGAPETTTHNITQVIQTVLAAQMVAKGDLLGSSEPRTDAP